MAACEQQMKTLAEDTLNRLAFRQCERRVEQVCGGLCHVATVAGRADAPSLPRKSHHEPLAAARASGAGESEGGDAPETRRGRRPWADRSEERVRDQQAIDRSPLVDFDDPTDDHGDMVLFQPGHTPNRPFSDVSASHRGPALFLLCDGSVHPVNEEIDFTVSSALGPRPGGEVAAVE